MKKIATLILFIFSISAFAQQTSPLFVLPGHTNDINCLAISPWSGMIATGGNDKVINLYKSDSPFKLIKNLGTLVAPINSIRYSRDGKLLAAGLNDNSIHIWDSVYKPVKIFEGHTDKINALCFDLYRRNIFSGGDDRKIMMWDLQTNKAVKTINFGQIVTSLAQSNNPLYLFAAGYDTKIRMYAVADGAIKASFDGHKDIVNSICISPNNLYMVSGSNDKTARLWDLKTGKEIRKYGVGCWKVTTVAFSKDGKHIITGCNDGSVKIWETETGQLVTAIVAEEENIRAVDFTPNGKFAYAATMLRSATNYGVRVWHSKIDFNKVIIPVSPDSARALLRADSIAQRKGLINKTGKPNVK